LTAYVFLDRDGTLVEDPAGYVHRIDDYALRPHTGEGLAELRHAGFRFAILTNQSGIGRGYYTQTDFERFQAHLLRDLRRFGVEIDATFFCPHLPTAGCECRKPRTGLLDQARAVLDVDLAHSWVIGDSEADIALAESAGCRSVQIRASPGNESEAPCAVRATYRAAHLGEAARLILGRPRD